MPTLTLLLIVCAEHPDNRIQNIKNLNIDRNHVDRLTSQFVMTVR